MYTNTNDERLSCYHVLEEALRLKNVQCTALNVAYIPSISTSSSAEGD